MARTPKVSVPKAAEFVNVACRLPQGLIIQLPSGNVVKLQGTQSPYAVAGHGITRGVPAALWAEVEAAYSEAKWLQQDLVFAMPDLDSVNAKAQERQAVRAGFEKIDPNHPEVRTMSALIQPEGARDPHEA